MLTTLLIICALAVLLIGVMGRVGIYIVALVGALIWVAAPAILTLGLGLIGILLAPVLKLLAPDTWEIVNRAGLEERRRRQFFKSLDRANAAAANRLRLDHGDRAGKVHDRRAHDLRAHNLGAHNLSAQVGSLSGPQFRPLEHRARLPDPPAKAEQPTPHDWRHR
jgi:hypothetical protein